MKRKRGEVLGRDEGMTQEPILDKSDKILEMLNQMSLRISELNDNVRRIMRKERQHYALR